MVAVLVKKITLPLELTASITNSNGFQKLFRFLIKKFWLYVYNLPWLKAYTSIIWQPNKVISLKPWASFSFYITFFMLPYLWETPDVWKWRGQLNYCSMADIVNYLSSSNEFLTFTRILHSWYLPKRQKMLEILELWLMNLWD